VLVVLAGLPGSGKSTVAAALGRELRAPVLPVDAAEAAMWRAGIDASQQPEVGLAAYAVVQAFAAEMLDIGLTVVVDAANLVEPARAAWRELTDGRDVPLRWIEVVCTDAGEHRRRLERRGTRYAGFREPTWADVLAREVEPWQDERLVLDAVRPLEQLVADALAYLVRPPE